MMNIEGEFYVTPVEAARIISEKSGRTVSHDYIRNLARYGKLHPKKVNERFSVYPLHEVEAIRVEPRGGKHKQDRVGRPVPKRSGQKKMEPSLAG